MKQIEKNELISELKSLINSAKGYAIIEFFAIDSVIQEYREKVSKLGGILKKVKLKVLEKALDVPKNTFYGQVYILVMKNLISIPELYELHENLKYYTTYKEGEKVTASYLIEKGVLPIRPSKFFKDIEVIAPVKLNKGFIEVFDNYIVTKDENIVSVNAYIQNELNVKPKPMYGKILEYYIKNSKAPEISSLNQVLNMIDNLPEYILHENGLCNLFNADLHTLDYSHYEQIKNYLPSDVRVLENLVGYGGANLVTKCGIQVKTKTWSRSNLTSILYLLLLSVYDNKKYGKISSIFTNETEFNSSLEQYNAKNMYELFNKIYTSLNTKDSNVQTTVKTVNTDFDDLF